MSDVTVNLEMPYILPSQAQKHVTHNEALQRLDAITQLTVAAGLTSPPSDPPEGACYAIAAAASGDWAGKSGKLAFRQDGGWIFIAPREGWLAWFRAEDRLKVHDGSDWADHDAIGTPAHLGINATADSVNRLAVAAAASLFTHDGHGHQLKINKAAASDTESLVFQDGFSGRAEIGLSGSDAFSIKVSPDGSTWTEALEISAGGQIRMPQRPLVRATLGGGVLTPATGSETGFSTLHVSQGGFSLGSAVSGGGHGLSVPITSAYLVCLAVKATSGGAFGVAVKVNGATTIASISETTSAVSRTSATGLAMLAAGDVLTLQHSGTVPLDFGYDRTELTVVML